MSAMPALLRNRFLLLGVALLGLLMAWLLTTRHADRSAMDQPRPDFFPARRVHPVNVRPLPPVPAADPEDWFTEQEKIAGCHYAAGRIAESLAIYQAVLDRRKELNGPDHPAVATLLDAMATVLRETGRSDEAEPLARQALQIDEKAYGPESAQVAHDLHSLGLILRAKVERPEAERVLQIGRAACRERGQSWGGVAS